MKYFGTDGFRGRANEELTVDHAFKIGKFVAGTTASARGARPRRSLARIPVVPAICTRTRWLRASWRAVPMRMCCA